MCVHAMLTCALSYIYASSMSQSESAGILVQVTGLGEVFPPAIPSPPPLGCWYGAWFSGDSVAVFSRAFTVQFCVWFSVEVSGGLRSPFAAEPLP